MTDDQLTAWAETTVKWGARTIEGTAARGVLRLLAERNVYDPSRTTMMSNGYPNLRAWTGCAAEVGAEHHREAIALLTECDALQRFKSWLHGFLDGKEVPHHPPGTHGAAGCRIGDRMDWVWERLDSLSAEVERLTLELDTVRRSIGTRESEASVIAERDRLIRLSPLCAGHGSGPGSRSGCPYCELTRLGAALSAIDYAMGPPNEMECSQYDVDRHEGRVVEEVKRLAERNAELCALVAAFKTDAEADSEEIARLAAKLDTLQKAHAMLQDGALVPLTERDFELKQSNRRLAEELAELRAACEPFAGLIHQVSNVASGYISVVATCYSVRRLAALLARTPPEAQR